MVFGGTDRVVRVVRKVELGSKPVEVAMLSAHEASVTSVFVSDDFCIFVSASLDHTCVIWDLNRLRFIRSMQTSGPVHLVSISPVNGDIVAVAQVSEEKRGAAVVWLYNVNGDLIASTTTNENILCILFSSGMEGVERNVVFAGTQSGLLLVFDAWDLTLLATRESTGRAPVTCLTMDAESVFLVSGSADGKVQQWVCGSEKFLAANLGI